MSKNTVTQEQIDGIIAASTFEVFHRVHGKQCLVVAKLPNGFTVVGESACVDANNYDEQIGYDLAVKHIKNRIWELEGYALQNRLYESSIIEQVTLNPGEKILTEGGLISLPSLPCAELLPQVRYEKSTYIGNVNTTETIEGTVEDVLKVIAYSLEQLDAESKG